MLPVSWLVMPSALASRFARVGTCAFFGTCQKDTRIHSNTEGGRQEFRLLFLLFSWQGEGGTHTPMHLWSSPAWHFFHPSPLLYPFLSFLPSFLPISSSLMFYDTLETIFVNTHAYTHLIIVEEENVHFCWTQRVHILWYPFPKISLDHFRLSKQCLL